MGCAGSAGGDHERRPATATYRYNHLGLRVGKQVGRSAQHYLYDDGRHRVAELDEHGQVTRMYVWLADQLVAVIDPPRPLPPQGPAHGWLAQLVRMLAGAGRAWSPAPSASATCMWTISARRW